MRINIRLSIEVASKAYRGFKPLLRTSSKIPNSLVLSTLESSSKGFPLTPVLGSLGVLGFIALSQGHGAPNKGPSKEEFQGERALSKNLIQSGKTFQCRVYYWHTDFRTGECGHVSASILVDGVAKKHFGHWPADDMGSSPLSILVPAASAPAKSLEEDMAHETKLPRTIEFQIDEKQAREALAEIDRQHHRQPCYSITPFVSKSLHSITRLLPGGPNKERPIENCTTISHKIVSAAGIIDKNSGEYQIPTTLFIKLYTLPTAKSVSPDVKIEF